MRCQAWQLEQRPDQPRPAAPAAAHDPRQQEAVRQADLPARPPPLLQPANAGGAGALAREPARLPLHQHVPAGCADRPQAPQGQGLLQQHRCACLWGQGSKAPCWQAPHPPSPCPQRLPLVRQPCGAGSTASCRELTGSTPLHPPAQAARRSRARPAAPARSCRRWCRPADSCVSPPAARPAARWAPRRPSTPSSPSAPRTPRRSSGSGTRRTVRGPACL